MKQLNFNVALDLSDKPITVDIVYATEFVRSALDEQMCNYDLSTINGATPGEVHVSYVPPVPEIILSKVQATLTDDQKDLLTAVMERYGQLRTARSTTLVEHVSPTMQILHNEGTPLFSKDSSIEVRSTPANKMALADDPHRARAADVLGIKPEDVTPVQRVMGKALNYVLAYTPANADPINVINNNFGMTFTDEEKARVLAYLNAQRRPDYKAIAEELFDALYEARLALSWDSDAAAEELGQMQNEIAGLLDRVEADVKGK